MLFSQGNILKKILEDHLIYFLLNQEQLKDRQSVLKSICLLARVVFTNSYLHLSRIAADETTDLRADRQTK